MTALSWTSMGCSIGRYFTIPMCLRWPRSSEIPIRCSHRYRMKRTGQTRCGRNKAFTGCSLKIRRVVESDVHRPDAKKHYAVSPRAGLEESNVRKEKEYV